MIYKGATKNERGRPGRVNDRNERYIGGADFLGLRLRGYKKVQFY